MILLVRGEYSEQLVFAGITQITVRETQTRTLIRVHDDTDLDYREIDLSNCTVELLPESKLL